jgi:hypothetical protein
MFKPEGILAQSGGRQVAKDVCKSCRFWCLNRTQGGGGPRCLDFREDDSMKLYHQTTAAVARAILRNGFIDGTGHYLSDDLHSGVWLSDTPLDLSEGASGDTLPEVELAITDHELAQYEWIEEGKPYREWLIPAAAINCKMKLRIVGPEEGTALPPSSA